MRIALERCSWFVVVLDVRDVIRQDIMPLIQIAFSTSEVWVVFYVAFVGNNGLNVLKRCIFFLQTLHSSKRLQLLVYVLFSQPKSSLSDFGLSSLVLYLITRIVPEVAC